MNCIVICLIRNKLMAVAVYLASVDLPAWILAVEDLKDSRVQVLKNPRLQDLKDPRVQDLKDRREEDFRPLWTSRFLLQLRMKRGNLRGCPQIK